MKKSRSQNIPMHNALKYKCLSIAGFDGSGGAGLQADLKTFSALGCYGMNVLTALPIQNTCGVRQCYPIPLRAIQEQLESIFDDITPDSIKIGMLFSADIIELVAQFLSKRAPSIPIILDPVMLAKSGAPLLLPDAISALKTKLLPQVALLTPNLPEAYQLTGLTEDAPLEDLRKALLSLGAQAVLLKGGHGKGECSNDLLLRQNGQQSYFKAPRIVSKNTHGTGCTLSAAICAYMARGFPLEKSCQYAKNYLFQAILAAKDTSLGKGCGPVNHLWVVSPFDSTFA